MEKTEIANPETTETDVNEIPKENIFAENLSFLELLLNDNKERTRNYDKVQTHVQDLINTEPNAPEKFGVVIKLLLQAEISVVEGFFEQEWQNLSPESQKLVVNEVLSLPAGKSTTVTRQAAAAQLIVGTDKENASRIIFQIITSGAKQSFKYKDLEISKEKKNALLKRFFPENGSWTPIFSSDEKIMHTLILLFSDLTEDIKDFGKSPYIGVAHNFSKWLIESLKQASFDNEQLNKLESRLTKIINRLPPSAQEELKQLKNKPLIKPDAKKELVKEESAKKEIIEHKSGENDSSESPSPTEITQKEVDTEKVSGKNKVSIKSGKKEPQQTKDTLKIKSPEPIQKKLTENISGLASPEQLLKEKQAALVQLSGEIEIYTKLIAERDSLIEKQKDLQKRLDAAYDETDKFQGRIKSLRDNFDQLEKDLTKTRDERDNALNHNNQLKKELSRLAKELEEKTKSLESERSEYVESSIKEVQFEIDNFKGSLKQKLRPIFENKRQTDTDPTNEKLAEFLRRWFNQIEEVLKKSGINP